MARPNERAATNEAEGHGGGDLAPRRGDWSLMWWLAIKTGDSAPRALAMWMFDAVSGARCAQSRQSGKQNKSKSPFKTLPDWKTFAKNFKSIKTENLESYIIQGILNNGTEDYLETLNKISKKEYCIQLMSLPEYQMC